MTDASNPGPFKGLASFQDSAADERLFFGRGREREIIVANLLASRLTVLYGETGVGKSSVLRAGVARDLRTLPDPLVVVVFGEWRDDPARALDAQIAEAAGVEPQGRLADTLELSAAMVGGEVVLLLDGLEEEVLYHGGDERPGSFLDEFSEAATRPGLRASLLLAVREDALAKLDRFKSRIPNVFGNYLRLEHLGREAGREAIVGPVERWNESAESAVEVEPALVDAVLDQVATGKVEIGQAGRGGVDDNGSQRIEAPYLQLVMARLWEAEARAGSGALRLETLQRLGGAEQIVRDHLEDALGALDPAQQDVAAGVFNHLVTPSGTKIAHDASDLAGYLGARPNEVEPVLSALAVERILRPVPGGRGSELPRYEIYHDILAPAVLAWRTRHESGREVERVREQAAQRHRRLVLLAAGALVLAAAMAIVTIFAFTQRSEAQDQTRKAQAHALEASALSQLSTDPELSVLLAVDAAKRDPSGQAESVLRQALLAAHERAIFPAAGPVAAAHWSPDGKYFLVAGGGVAHVFDARTHRLLGTFRQHATITAADFSPDEAFVMTAGVDGRLRIWLPDGRLLNTLRLERPIRSAVFDPAASRLAAVAGRTLAVWPLGDNGLPWRHRFAFPVTQAAFSPDSRSIVVIGNDREARLYDADSGKLLRTFDQGDFVKAVAFSPDGHVLVTGGRNDTAIEWDAATGKQLHVLKGHTQDVVALAFSRDGKTLATGSTDGTARTWDVATGTAIGTFSGHSNAVTSVSFSPDGNELLTSSADRTARVWRNSDTPDVIALLAGHRGAVTAASFSSDGDRVLTASDDATARIWNVQPPALKVLARYPQPVVTASYINPFQIMVAGGGNAVRVIRSDTGRAVRIFPLPNAPTGLGFTDNRFSVAVGHGRKVSIMLTPRNPPAPAVHQPAVVTSVAYTDTNDLVVVTGGTDGLMRVYHEDGPFLYARRAGRRAITSVAISPDGSLIATASRDGTARVWDLETGHLVHTLVGHRAAVTSVAFSPDGKEILTASADHDARLWDAKTGASLQVLRWHFGTVTDAQFSPDGRWIVTAGPLTAQLWQPGVSQPLFTLGIVGPAKKLTSASFDPTSRIVLATSADGTVRTYRCDLCGTLPELLGLAHPDRTLTPAELKRFGG